VSYVASSVAWPLADDAFFWARLRWKARESGIKKKILNEETYHKKKRVNCR
jgi:hypothetical protein